MDLDCVGSDKDSKKGSFADSSTHTFKIFIDKFTNYQRELEDSYKA